MTEQSVKILFSIGVIFGFFGFVTCLSSPCQLRQEKYGGVCICTADYCDYLDDPTPKNEHEFVFVSSTKAGLRFETNEGAFNHTKKFIVTDYEQKRMQQQTDEVLNNERATNARHVHLNIDRDKRYQKIVGFGGSFSGAVVYLLNFLPQALQDHLYDSYYGEHGIGFNLMRMPIGGCDFDLAPWAYNELPVNDTDLSNFTLDARDELRVTQIKRLIEVSKVKNLRIKGAAWSSPPWMKTNNKWTGRSRLRPEYYQTWANYHLKWLELMEENGLNIWAISTGNEPLNGVLFMYIVKFMSLGWTPRGQAIWLADHLGPTIRNSKYKDLIIFGNDDQRYTFPYWFHVMNATRNNSLDYLDGLAVHWYWDEVVPPSFMDKAHAEMPDKILLETESCVGDKIWQQHLPLLGSWERGEKYARAFLQDLQHAFNGWIDWNLILDENGGPNYVNNTVDAPIVVDMKNTTEVVKQPMFYTIGHFSKFIPENSIRIDAVRSNVNIDSVAFLRPDGTISVVVFNSGNANVDVSFTDSLRGTIAINIPPRSIHTVIYH